MSQLWPIHLGGTSPPSVGAAYHIIYVLDPGTGMGSRELV